MDSVDGQKIYVKNEEGTVLSKFFKPYQLVKVDSVDSVEKYENPNESHEEEHKGDSKSEEASEGVESCRNKSREHC